MRYRRVWIWSLSVVGLLGLLIVGGAIYERVAEWRVQRLYPPPGKLVDIGSATLHLLCTGPSGEGATIVLEAGGGDISLAWRPVQPRLAERHRVCSYDRAGQGWSTPSTRPRTPEVVADELRRALHAAGEPGPYLLVGHSRGGIFARSFAQLYPAETAGLVLVDSSVDGVASAPPPLEIEERQVQLLSVARWLAPFGIPRVLRSFGTSPKGDGPAAAEMALRVAASAVAANYAEMMSIRAGQVGPALQDGALGAKPVLVLTATGPLRGLESLQPAQQAEIETYRHAFQAAQAAFLPLSTLHRQVFARRSGHYIYRDEPDLFETVIERAWDGRLDEIPADPS
jgi:pimeloyl-ACP methyl ester carboxylesterase